MKSFFNETNIKIGLIGLIIVGMILLSNYQKANSEFNISDMSIINSLEKLEEKIMETPKIQTPSQSVQTIAVVNSTETTVVTQILPIDVEEKKADNTQLQPETISTPVGNNQNISEEKEVETKPETTQEKQTPIESQKEKKIEVESSAAPVKNTNIAGNVESKKPETIPAENKENSAVLQKEEKVILPAETIKTGAEMAAPVLADKVEEKKEISVAAKTEAKIVEEKKVPVAAENKAVQEQKFMPLVEENKTQQKENLAEANKPKKTPEKRVINSNFTNLNLFVVLIAIMMNLIVYSYVYRHLSMNISKNLEGLKNEMIELEESFSYRSITDI